MIAIADGPADEVWMGLIAERLVDRCHDAAKGRRMCGIPEGMEKCHTIASRDVEFARSPFSNISSDDAGNFLTEWLDSNYGTLSAWEKQSLLI
jgi:hypothetical protein